MQSVGAQHESIARKHLMILDIHVHEEGRSERAAQDVACLGLRDFILGQKSQRTCSLAMVWSLVSNAISPRRTK